MPRQGEILGVLGAGGPQNLNCGDCDPQKAHLWVIPSRLSIYTSKSVHGFGLAAFPRKKSNTRSIFRKNSPSHRLSLVGPVGRQRVKDDNLCEWKTANFGALRGRNPSCDLHEIWLAHVITSTSSTILPNLIWIG